jgi:acetyltransferase-like isoleucine patch superfamily enzyme
VAAPAAAIPIEFRPARFWRVEPAEQLARPAASTRPWRLARLERASEGFGVWWWVKGGIRRRPGLWLARARHPRVRFGQRCDVRRGDAFRVGRRGVVRFGSGCVLDHGLTVESLGVLDVGDRTVFGHHCTIGVVESVTIGRDCLIGELVSIRDHDHGFASSDIPMLDQAPKAAPVVIGDNVWLAGKVTVTGGVTIGDNTIVGANAVVTRDLPPDCIAGGIPARVIRYRSGALAPPA